MDAIDSHQLRDDPDRYPTARTITNVRTCIACGRAAFTTGDFDTAGAATEHPCHGLVDAFVTTGDGDGYVTAVNGNRYGASPLRATVDLVDDAGEIRPKVFRLDQIGWPDGRRLFPDIPGVPR